jgi:AraC family transcriptional regulator of adaptative response / DNA-3-methyladenine glycosylase II
MHEIRLPYRQPWHWAALRGFLARRAAPGTYAVLGETWLQSLRLGCCIGWLRITAEADQGCVRLQASESLLPCIEVLKARVVDALDLERDTDMVERHLAADPLLGRSVQANPGLRVPGAIDGFEVALRAILGQQVSVAGASTLFGRLVMRFGDALPQSQAGVERAVPDARRLAEVPAATLATIGLPRARAETLAGLARAVASGDLRLEPGDRDGARVLIGLRGIGPWTRDYIAMRVFRDTDAFPAADIGVRHALGGLSLAEIQARAERWRPWRSYATMHLWQLAAQGG